MVQTSKPFPGSPEFDGSDIWRATGPAGALVWSRVTGDGFGDTAIHNFESFCTHAGQMYVAASNLFSGNPGQIVPAGERGKNLPPERNSSNRGHFQLYSRAGQDLK